MSVLPTIEHLKGQVKKEWTDNAPAWRRWNAKMDVMTGDATTLLIEASRLEPGMRVLDLASGTGDPALPMARAVGGEGHVTATDFVSEMLDAARENARAQSIGNVSFEIADMADLPYPDASFDRVTARFGVMFCPNVEAAFAQIRRVLVPGGIASFIVWAPPAQPYFSSWLSPFRARAELPPPSPDAPTGFRFAKPGSLSEALRGAGFRGVTETTRTIRWNWPGPAAEMWKMQQDIVPQLLGRFRSVLSAEDYAAASAEALAAMCQHERDGNTYFDADVHVVTAAR